MARIGFKKANDIWENFISKIETSNVTKFYYWLKLVEYHYNKNLPKILYYLRTMSNDKENITDEEIRNSILGLDTLDKLRRGSYQKLEEYIDKYNFYEWIRKFNTIVNKAFFKYIKKRFPSKDIKNIKQRFEREREKYDYDFDNIKRKTLIVTAEIEYSIMTIFPDFLKCSSLEKLGFPKNKSLDVEKAIGYLQNRHPFNEKAFVAPINLARKKNSKNKKIQKILIDMIDNKRDPIETLNKLDHIYEKETKQEEIEKNKDYPSFFEKEDFFKDFEKQLKNLGIKNKAELYKDMRFQANLFKMPALKN